jgi:hypothetical protein
MTWFLIIWVSWSCPGGLFAPAWPPASRPIVCAPRPELQILSTEDAAQRAVRAAGRAGAPRLYSCRWLRCREQRVIWNETVTFN